MRVLVDLVKQHIFKLVSVTALIIIFSLVHWLSVFLLGIPVTTDEIMQRALSSTCVALSGYLLITHLLPWERRK